DYLLRDGERFPESAYRLTFTSNHDENSWQGTEFERMGDAANACAVLCFTLPGSQPLIYTGQEIGLDRRLAFFEKDPITDWSENAYTVFYKKLVQLKHSHPALNAGEQGGVYSEIEAPEGVYAFSREKEGDKVVVVVNFNDTDTSVALDLDGNYNELFSGESLNGSISKTLSPGGYLVLCK
ncbi:MAG: alpha amylase C-terminal domain-containing protein, partial [Bacteroidales bacterium]|nr:alpha amylase C-terminal domain-containing protein [Bacteroidales bacterium]